MVLFNWAILFENWKRYGSGKVKPKEHCNQESIFFPINKSGMSCEIGALRLVEEL